VVVEGFLDQGGTRLWLAVRYEGLTPAGMQKVIYGIYWAGANGASWSAVGRSAGMTAQGAAEVGARVTGPLRFVTVTKPRAQERAVDAGLVVPRSRSRLRSRPPAHLRGRCPQSPTEASAMVRIYN